MASEGYRERRKLAQKAEMFVKVETKERFNSIRQILKKDPSLRNEEELQMMAESQEIVLEIERRALRQEQAKRRVEEVLDPPEVLEQKTTELAQAILKAKCLVVYTGAGVSTAASIPDYRGPDGVWTRLSRGEKLGSYNLADAEPTLTHMSITKLHQQGVVQHVVSQNCDGLHIRSGLPPEALSEVHGNMFVEVCTECPLEDRVYYRLFDVTEETRVRRHQTSRYCHDCGSLLRDSIVHFGEKGNLRWPLNWEEAIEKAKKADCILCLGSSLKLGLRLAVAGGNPRPPALSDSPDYAVTLKNKTSRNVLKRYHALWGMTRVKTRRPNLYIVNLQWTPKDDIATLKISGRCDDVMRRVMNKLELNIPEYKRSKDPLFTLATPLRPHEFGTFSTKCITMSEPHRIMDPSSNTIKTGSLENQTDCCNGHQEIHHCSTETKEGVISSRPGWFGKGYAKCKRPTKKRRMR